MMHFLMFVLSLAAKSYNMEIPHSVALFWKKTKL